MRRKRTLMWTIVAALVAAVAWAYPIPIPQVPALQTVDLDAGMWSVDGTQCTTPTEVTINSGPKKWVAQCADNDSSIFYLSVALPHRYTGGAVYLEPRAVNTAASPSGVVQVDFSCQCRGQDAVINNIWGTAQSVQLPFSVQHGYSVGESPAITPNGTCSYAATMFCRGVVNATATTAAMGSVYFLGANMEYPINQLTDP